MRPTILAILLFCLVGVLNAQIDTLQKRPDAAPYLRSSAAYAEVVLRRAELEADLASMNSDLADTNPKIVDAKTELAEIRTMLDRLAAVKQSDSARLTEALGKLMVHRAAASAAVAHLLIDHTEAYPDVKRARKRVEAYDKAIDEILK